MADWSKEEYAEIHWNGIKRLIGELERSDCNDHDKMYQLIGYIDSYRDEDEKLKYDYETR